MNVGRILEITFLLVLVYLVLSRGREFSGAVTAIGNTYIKSVQALQGR